MGDIHPYNSTLNTSLWIFYLQCLSVLLKAVALKVQFMPFVQNLGAWYKLPSLHFQYRSYWGYHGSNRDDQWTEGVNLEGRVKIKYVALC